MCATPVPPPPARFTRIRPDCVPGWTNQVEFLFYMCIVLSAANSGLQTYDEYEHSDPVVMLGHFTNVMFAFEVLLKMAAESSSIMGYFSDL